MENILQIQLFLTNCFKAVIHVPGAIGRNRDFMIHFKQGQNRIDKNNGKMKQVLNFLTERGML